MKQLELRRKDRQKDEKFALEVVDESLFANISMYDGKEPYSVVISHVRKGESIYFLIVFMVISLSSLLLSSNVPSKSLTTNFIIIPLLFLFFLLQKKTQNLFLLFA